MNRTDDPPLARKALQLPSESLIETFFHKLSQPIGALHGCLELGLLKDDSTELKAAVQAAMLQAERLMWLFQVTRKFFATDFRANSRAISLRECLENALSNSKPLAHSAHVSLCTEITHDIIVTADPVYLRDAFENLLARSIRDAVPENRIAVELIAGKPGCVRICNELPYSLEAADQAFDPFPRGIEVAPGKAGSLDLAFSRQILRAFGGDVRLCPSSRGTQQFEITLPAAQ